MQLDLGPGGRLSVGPHGDGVLGFRAFIAIMGLLAMTYAVPARSQTAAQPPAGNGAGAIVAPTVRVTAPRVVTPLPGVIIQREQMSSNVQSATAGDIERAQTQSLTDFMNSTMQSVSVNDYQGNPFQQDLVFRGFAASPLIGTPQGLSVYVDGVRVNEPFGEVVNWDLIPVNAIHRMDLLPGSDPLFGLNTLGGALAISTKSGFTSPKIEGSILGGSWGRRQAKFSAGANNGLLGGFVAVNMFDEDGWRVNSPSSVRQAYGRLDLQGALGGLGLSLLHASNTLIGNGLVPYELYRQDPKGVFTSPDETTNKVNHFNGNGRLNLTEAVTMSAQTYWRGFDQVSRGGDVWEDFRATASRLRLDCNNGIPNATADGAIGVDLPGCPNLQPNGIFNIGRAGQTANGVSWQMNWLGEKSQIVFGAALDKTSIDFRQGQQLGFIDATREVRLAPERYDDLFLIPLVQEIQRNNLVGGSDSGSLYVKAITTNPDFWKHDSTLHLNVGLRYNRTRVTQQLTADRPIPLYQFDESLFRRLAPRCGAENGDPFARYYCTSGNYLYESLNPSAGVSWLPKETLNLYLNWSRGSRVPSTIELGCARDREAERLAGGGRNTGKTPGCSVPTALTYDPFLPQVISYTTEAGVRGSTEDGRVAWNAGVYQTNLSNDILFVSLGSRNRGVFDTFGKTRRRGLEFGMDGQFGRHRLTASYSRIDATFESTAEVVNLSNSSATKEVGKVSTFVIEPGDRIPGIPRDSLRLAWKYDATDRLNVGLSMIANGWSYVRGNENNAHSPGGTDSNGEPTLGTNDPTITVEPGRKYVGQGRIPGYAIFHLIATYQATKQLSFSLRLDNLFDRQYVTAGGLALSPFTASVWGVRDASGFNYNSNDWTHSTFVGPGAPRALWVSLNYVFDTERGLLN
jgi:iron complex outermembrane receptor protein